MHPLDLFHDGNPEIPTLDQVIFLIRKDGGPSEILHDWSLLEGGIMTVSVTTDEGTESADLTLDFSGEELSRSSSRSK